MTNKSRITLFTGRYYYGKNCNSKYYCLQLKIWKFDLFVEFCNI